MGDGIEHVGRQFAVLVGHGKAALAGQVKPVLAELIDWVPAVAGREDLVDRPLQVRQPPRGRLTVPGR